MIMSIELHDSLIGQAYDEARQRVSKGINFGHIDLFKIINNPTDDINDMQFNVYSFVYWLDGDNLEVYYCVKIDEGER